MNPNNHIRQVLARHGSIRMAILFGSLAKERATPQSDLDLAIQMDALLTAETKMALIGALSQAIGRPVDLIDQLGMVAIASHQANAMFEYLP